MPQLPRNDIRNRPYRQEKTRESFLPLELKLPLFAYGLFQPGQLGFLQITFVSDTPK